MQRLMRDPAYVAELRRQAALIAQHPQNAEIDDWIEQMFDWSDIVYDDDFDLPDEP